MKLLFLALMAAAAVSTLVGQGGGILYTPLQLWMGIPFQQAAATSLVLIVAASVSSALVFRRAGRIDWRLVWTVEPATMLGGFAGGFVSHHLPAWVLEALLGAVLLLAAPLLLRSTPLGPARARGPDRAGGSPRSPWIVLPSMCAVGLFTGSLGIGGGVLKVPVMILLLGVHTEAAIAASAVMVGLTALAGVAGHASVGHLPWSVALMLAAAVFAGAQLGSRLSLQLPTAQLRRVLVGVQVAVGAIVLVGALR